MFNDEFDERFAVPEELLRVLKTHGFSDASWHNDVCPHFEKETLAGRIEVWCDAALQSDSEYCDLDPKEWRRFLVQRVDDDGAVSDRIEDALGTSDVSEIIRFLEEGAF